MKHIKDFSEFQNQNVNEAQFSGRLLKSQKFIEMCIAVADKFQTQPDRVRETLVSHPLTYEMMKNITNDINKI